MSPVRVGDIAYKIDANSPIFSATQPNCTCSIEDVTTMGDVQKQLAAIRDPSCPHHGDQVSYEEVEVFDEHGESVWRGPEGTTHDLPPGTYSMRTRTVTPVGSSVWDAKKNTFEVEPETPEAECVRCGEVKALKTSTWNEHDPRLVGWWCYDCRVDAGFDVPGDRAISLLQSAHFNIPSQLFSVSTPRGPVDPWWKFWPRSR